MKKLKLTARQQTLHDIACEVREMARYAKQWAATYKALQHGGVSDPAASKSTLKKLIREKKARAKVCLEIAERIEAGEMD